MEYLQILQNILIAVGGGNGDPHTEYVRHVLPMVMWAALFVMVRTLHPRGSKLGRWFLITIGSAFLYQFSQLIVKSMNATTVVWGSVPPPMTTFDQLSGPLFAIWLAVTYWLLVVVTCRYVGSNMKSSRPINVIIVTSFVLLLLSAAVTAKWLHTTRDGFFQPFESSTEQLLLCYLYVVILAFAVVCLWQARHHSYVSRIAWVPFAMFLLSEVLRMTGRGAGHEIQLWLLPISNNLKIFAIPWFGLMFWRYAMGEQRRLALQLHQAERLDGVGRLAAGVAHDFNNHLQAILGYATAGAVDATSNSNERHHQRYNSITDSVERARVLVKLLTDFKREPAEDDIGVANLSNVVSELRPLLDSLLGTGIKTDYNLDPRADMVSAERSMLEQVIVNVMVNARDAMPKGGVITMSSKVLEQDVTLTQPRMVRITIVDTGTGLTANERSRVFEPFYTTKGAVGGSGLGLTASRTAVQRMGGSIEISSEVGNGTKLIIDLPASNVRVEPRIEEVEELSNTEMLSGTGQVLLADDEPSVRRVVAAYLQRAGYKTHLAEDGVQALELLSTQAQSIDLMVLDVLMPGKCGYETYLEAKKSYPSIPVIFITSQFDLSRCKAPQEPHLIKPFKHDELLRLIRTTLKNRQTKMTSENAGLCES